MRVYFPATTRTLGELVDSGELGPPPLTGFAVTPQLRAWYRDSDSDELEYAALLDAARGSLRLLDQDPDAMPRQVGGHAVSCNLLNRVLTRGDGQITCHDGHVVRAC